DLHKYPADFTLISMYKMFGYPTGLAAIIVNNKSLSEINHYNNISNQNSHYFGGNTIDFMQPRINSHVFKASVERFHHGTLNYQGILSIAPGLKLLTELKLSNITYHTHTL